MKVDLLLTNLAYVRHFLSAFMATNAGAGAARQLQSARTATAVWKVSSYVHHGQNSAEPSRSTLFSHMVYGSEFGELLLSIRKGRPEFL